MVPSFAMSRRGVCYRLSCILKNSPWRKISSLHFVFFCSSKIYLNVNLDAYTQNIIHSHFWSCKVPFVFKWYKSVAKFYDIHVCLELHFTIVLLSSAESPVWSLSVLVYFMKVICFDMVFSLCLGRQFIEGYPGWPNLKYLW